VAAITDQPSVGLTNGLEVAGLVVGERGMDACQDRASVIPTESGLVLVLADGAGGLAGGALAADAVVAAVTAACAGRRSNLGSAQFWVDVLEGADVQLATRHHGGQSTAVICAVDRGIVGAAVGDSVAWIVHPSGVADLTNAQTKRPLIGSGQAAVVPIASEMGDRTLLLASDGLAKYASRAKIAMTALDADLARSTGRLLELARLRSGALQDDVSVVLCRRQLATTV
jgi:serine/threonine protein phosphatase PrpC